MDRLCRLRFGNGGRLYGLLTPGKASRNSSADLRTSVYMVHVARSS